VPKSQDFNSKDAKARRREMGRRIRSARKDMQLTQTDLAVKLTVAVATISGWELGKYSPSGENLRRVSDTLAVSTSFLNPEKLRGGKQSLEQLSRALGSKLGRSRVAMLVEIPSRKLHHEVDSIIGSYVVDQSKSTGT